MKKFTSLTLVIALLLSFCLQLNAANIEEAQMQSLPKEGQVISGFKVIEIGYMDIINSKTVLFEHEKTGAQLFYIQSRDIDRSFEIAFRTPAVDNTGVNHILEHITVSGSEKYPMKNVLFTIANQTYSTFINAFTTATSTIFPVSSMSEEQLLKLAEVYLDCVYYPSIYTDKNIFQREAWRYEMADAAAPLEINGTVYNEMKGALGNLSSAAYYNVMKALYSNSIQTNISGGDPDYIKDLTYDQLIETHKNYYHPSNSLMILYGDLDYTRFLEMINDEYLKDFDKKEMNIDYGEIEPLQRKTEKTYKFPVNATASTVNASRIDYAFAINNASEEELIGLSILSAILNQETSPLNLAFAEKQIGGRIIVSLDDSIIQPMLTFTAENADENKKHEFMSLVDSCVNDLINNGYDKELTNAMIYSTLLSFSNMTEMSNIGVNISLSTAIMWANSGDVNYFSNLIQNIINVSEKIEDNYFEELTAKYIKNNNHAALVTTIPEPGLSEQIAEQQQAYLTRLKALMSEQQIEGIVNNTKSYSEWNSMETDPKVVDKLQVVKVADLPVEVKSYSINEKELNNGIRMLSAAADVAETGFTTLLFDARAVPVEKLHYLPLVVDLLGSLDTKSFTKELLNTLNIRYLNGASIYLSVIDHEARNDFTPVMNVSWSGLMGEYTEQVDIITEILLNTKFSDANTILSIVKQQISAWKNMFTNNPINVLMYRNMANSDACNNYQSYLSGFEYHDFLIQLEQKLQTDPAGVLAELESVYGLLINGTNMITLFAGNESNIESYENEMTKLIDVLPVNAITAQDYSKIPAPAKKEGIAIDTPVQYNMISADYDSMGTTFSGKFIPIGLVISENYITPKIRFGYGAYDNIVNFSSSSFMLVSYRDPNIRETFEVYQGLPEFIRNLSITQEELDRYILKAFSDYTGTMGELNGAINAMNNYLLGKTDDDRLKVLQEIKSVTVDDLINSAEMIEKFLENGAWSTVGRMEKIEANKDLYDTIITFGQQTTQEPGQQEAEELVTRAQLMQLLLGSVTNEPMETAKQAGLLQGDGNGNYFEDKFLTKEEFAIILERLVLLNGMQLGGDKVIIADEADISPWAVNSVNALVASGVIKLDADGNFHPKDNITGTFVITAINELAMIISGQ